MRTPPRQCVRTASSSHPGSWSASARTGMSPKARRRYTPSASDVAVEVSHTGPTTEGRNGLPNTSRTNPQVARRAVDRAASTAYPFASPSHPRRSDQPADEGVVTSVSRATRIERAPSPSVSTAYSVPGFAWSVRSGRRSSPKRALDVTALEHPVGHEPLKPPVDRRVGAKFGRQPVPLHPRPQPVDDAVRHPAEVAPGRPVGAGRSPEGCPPAPAVGHREWPG